MHVRILTPLVLVPVPILQVSSISPLRRRGEPSALRTRGEPSAPRTPRGDSLPPVSSPWVEEMRRAFHLFNTNGDGQLTTDEFANILCRNTSSGNTLSRADVQEILDDFDDDRSGALDIEEFLRAMAEIRPEASVGVVPAQIAEEPIAPTLFSMASREVAGTISPLRHRSSPLDQRTFKVGASPVLRRSPLASRGDSPQVLMRPPPVSWRKGEPDAHKPGLPTSSSLKPAAAPSPWVEEMRRAFHLFNTKGDGQLTTDEFANILCRNTSSGNTLSRADVQEILDDFDDDRSGALDIEEFLRAMAEIRPEAGAAGAAGAAGGVGAAGAASAASAAGAAGIVAAGLPVTGTAAGADTVAELPSGVVINDRRPRIFPGMSPLGRRGGRSPVKARAGTASSVPPLRPVDGLKPREDPEVIDGAPGWLQGVVQSFRSFRDLLAAPASEDERTTNEESSSEAAPARATVPAGSASAHTPTPANDQLEPGSVRSAVFRWQQDQRANHRPAMCTSDPGTFVVSPSRRCSPLPSHALNLHSRLTHTTCPRAARATAGALRFASPSP